MEFLFMLLTYCDYTYPVVMPLLLKKECCPGGELFDLARYPTMELFYLLEPSKRLAQDPISRGRNSSAGVAKPNHHSRISRYTHEVPQF